jgi:uncharacterized membrane protein HdeD (DUF308 family)
MLAAAARQWWVFILEGILGILLGILVLAYPDIALLTAAYLFAAWAIISGIGQIYEGWRVAELRGRSWPFALIGVLSIVAGIIAAFLPGLSLATLFIILGAWLLVIGVMVIYSAWHIRKEVSGEWVLALIGILTAVIGLVVLVYPSFGAALALSFVSLWSIVWGVFALILGFRLRGLKTRVESAAPPAAARA